MRVVRYVSTDGRVRIGLDVEGVVQRLPVSSMAELLAGDLRQLREMVGRGGPEDSDIARLLAPVDGATEVWAAGVTYRRSRDARMEEARERDPYERVYVASRPELFFKSVAWRVRGPGEPIGIRSDSTIDVPEPELAIVLTASSEIAGYTICNDMSSRSIEGENPLYLPQAKTYHGSCSLGPAVLLAEDAEPSDRIFVIEIVVRRDADVVWQGRTDTGEMVRTFAELLTWLYAEQDFPAGAVLSTGTGLVPDLGFTLQPGDEVAIGIPEIGTLTNAVVRGRTDGAMPKGGERVPVQR